MPVSALKAAFVLLESKLNIIKSPVNDLPSHLIKPSIFSVAPVAVVSIPTYPDLPIVASKKKSTASSSEPPGTPNILYEVRSAGEPVPVKVS